MHSRQTLEDCRKGEGEEQFDSKLLGIEIAGSSLIRPRKTFKKGTDDDSP